MVSISCVQSVDIFLITDAFLFFLKGSLCPYLSLLRNSK